MTRRAAVVQGCVSSFTLQMIQKEGLEVIAPRFDSSWLDIAANKSAARARQVLMSTAPLHHQQIIGGTFATDGSQAFAGTVHGNVYYGARGCPYKHLVESSFSFPKPIMPLANAPQAPPKPVSTVPFRRDPDFINRGDLLLRVDERCSQAAGRAALVGLGGVGKSQLGIEYAYRVRERAPETWVFWVHAGTQARFEEGYRTIAKVASIPGWDDPKADILRLVWSWLCYESNGPWVLIVDSADDSDVFSRPDYGHRTNLPDRLDQPVEALSDYLPQSSNGSILVTSRSRDAAFRLIGRNVDIIPVGPMNQVHALVLIEKKLQGRFEECDVVGLAEALDFIPLAINQAAAYISLRTPRVTISRYLQNLRKGDADRAKLLEKDVGDSRRDGNASNSIIANWQMSFEHIRRVRPSATRLLSLMSLFDRQGIPESLLIGHYHHDDTGSGFEDDLYMLLNFSLIAANADGSQFEMHPLVQFSMKRWLELNEELEEWKEKYVLVIDESFPRGEYEDWTMCRKLYPHARAAIEYRPADAAQLKTWASILYRAAWYVQEMQRYQAAI